MKWRRFADCYEAEDGSQIFLEVVQEWSYRLRRNVPRRYWVLRRRGEPRECFDTFRDAKHYAERVRP